nr:RNA-directed DNA polymerase, eukaryota [Tanacetum cinerariifolium]
MDVKFMWGNSNYNYVYSEAVGNSGGIHCVWEATVFKKDYATISDNFVGIYGHGYLVIPRSFPNGCNSSFVTLIPMITDARFVNDFRPISLIGSVYKVVTKVLANRLA